MVYATLAATVISGTTNLRLTFLAPRGLRPTFAALAALSYFYSAAYIVLLSGPWSQADWTRGIRFVSLFGGWGFVWIFVPWRFSNMAGRARVAADEKKVEAAQQILEHVAERLGVDVDG